MKTKQRLAGLLALTALTVVGFGAGWSNFQPTLGDVQSPPVQVKTPKPARLDRLGDPLPAGVISRIGSGRLRQGDVVTALAYSPDGTVLASSGKDNTVRFWDTATGKELWTGHAHKATIKALA